MLNNVDEPVAKPEFFIVGAPKAGTTSLYNYFNNCGDIYMSDVKEPNYFSCDNIREQDLFYEVENVCDYSEYLNLFKGASINQLCGEASVSYLYYPDVAKNIYKFNNASKIIIVLREPIDRAISHYNMDYRLGYVKKKFGDVINGCEDNYFQQYIKLGLYHEQVKRYLDLFGKGRVKIFIFDDFVRDSRTVFSDALKFLDIEVTADEFDDGAHNNAIYGKFAFISFLYKQGVIRRYVVNILPDRYKSRLKSLLFSDTGRKQVYEKERAWLASYYKEDILKLQELINQDLSHWVE